MIAAFLLESLAASYGWLAFAGLFVGVLVRPVLPRTRRLGVVLAAVLGAAGAALGAWAGAASGVYAPGELSALGAAAAGAAVLVGVAGWVLG